MAVKNKILSPLTSASEGRAGAPLQCSGGAPRTRVCDSEFVLDKQAFMAACVAGGASCQGWPQAGGRWRRPKQHRPSHGPLPSPHHRTEDMLLPLVRQTPGHSVSLTATAWSWAMGTGWALSEGTWASPPLLMLFCPSLQLTGPKGPLVTSSLLSPGIQ